jgi:hypothetical protein
MFWFQIRLLHLVVHAYVYVHARARTHTHTHRSMPMYMHMRARAHTHTHTCPCLCICTCARAHTHTHTHIHRSPRRLAPPPPWDSTPANVRQDNSPRYAIYGYVSPPILFQPASTPVEVNSAECSPRGALHQMAPIAGSREGGGGVPYDRLTHDVGDASAANSHVHMHGHGHGHANPSGMAVERARGIPLLVRAVFVSGLCSRMFRLKRYSASFGQALSAYVNSFAGTCCLGLGLFLYVLCLWTIFLCIQAEGT